MKDRDFKLWLEYFCRIPLLNPSTLSPRSKCKEVYDVYGDHLLYCKCGVQRNWRDECQVRLVVYELLKAGRHPTTEESPTGAHKQRPDIRTLGTAGGTHILDFIIIHPLSASFHRRKIRKPQASLDHAKVQKKNRYQALMADAGCCHRLVFLPMSTLDGWHSDAYRYMAGIADYLARRTMV